MATFTEYFSHSFDCLKTELSDGRVRKYLAAYVVLMSAFSALIGVFSSVLDSASSPLAIGAVLVGFFIVLVAFMAGVFFFSVRVAGSAMSALGLRTREYGFGIKYILSCLWSSLLALALWMDKRLLVGFLAAGVVLLAVFVAAISSSQFVAMASLVLLVLLSIPYLFLAVYHSYKLVFAPYLFLSGRPFFSAPAEAWSLSHTRTLLTFGLTFAVSLVLMFVIFPLSMVQMALVGVANYALSGTAALAVHFFVAFFCGLVTNAVSSLVSLFVVGMFHYVLVDSGRLGEFSVAPAPVAKAAQKTAVARRAAVASKKPARIKRA